MIQPLMRYVVTLKRVDGTTRSEVVWTRRGEIEAADIAKARAFGDGDVKAAYPVGATVAPVLPPA